MDKQKGKSLKQNILKRGQTFISIFTILHHGDVSDLYLQSLKQFKHTMKAFICKVNCLKNPVCGAMLDFYLSLTGAQMMVLILFLPTFRSHLHLSHPKNLSKQCFLLVVTLTFIRLCNYPVNAMNLNWKDSGMYQWCSLLLFTSFHTP